MDNRHVIRPYLWLGCWVFDDIGRGLKKEALVSGADLLALKLANASGVKDPEKGFELRFSSEPMPGATRFDWVEEEGDGNWYTNEAGERGWLCPALLKYFSEAPDSIWALACEEDAQKPRAALVGLLGSEWVSNNEEARELTWKVTDVAQSVGGESFVVLTDVAGIAPVVLTLGNLRKKFHMEVSSADLPVVQGRSGDGWADEDEECPCDYEANSNEPCADCPGVVSALARCGFLLETNRKKLD